MVKHTIDDHPELIVNFHVVATFFGSGHKFDMPNFKEPIKNLERNKTGLVVVGAVFTKCSISGPENLLDKIEIILKTLTGKPISHVKRVEVD